MEINKFRIESEFRKLQIVICNEIETLDNKGLFKEDAWKRKEGGGGYTRIILEGNIIEKGGVAFSAVHGNVTDAMRNQLAMADGDFFASGVSVVLHPRHPSHPIIHMNVRYFELDNGTYWFGGGIDLSPHYVDLSAARAFHLALKKVCDKYNPEFYPKFKSWADTYFFLPHRNESRGVGGIFFDNLNENSGLSKKQVLNFCLDLGRIFPLIYREQIEFKAYDTPTLEELKWQALRRGRYVEFNLLHDRGTKFGIYSSGRTESILMSMPPMANWEYNFTPDENSEEDKTMKFLNGKIKSLL
jgi:coproporphyrinogen III oxidase